MDTGERLNILGIPIDRVDMKEAVLRFDDFLKQEACSLIVTPNSEILERATKNPKLADIIRSADMVIPDGIGLVYASKFLGKPLKERVTGVDFLSQAFTLLSERQGSVFLLGGKPKTADEKSVAEEAAENIKKAYPGLKVAGHHHGYFSEEDQETILEKINSSVTDGVRVADGARGTGRSGAGQGVGEGRIDLLCVALGSPKQEEFMWKYKDRLAVKTAIGVGGSLDVWAGRVKRAPEFYQKHGLEWLYRAVKEPARFVRLLSLPVFMAKVVARKTSDKAQDR